jgi:hypothetical protein
MRGFSAGTGVTEFVEWNFGTFAAMWLLVRVPKYGARRMKA